MAQCVYSASKRSRLSLSSLLLFSSPAQVCEQSGCNSPLMRDKAGATQCVNPACPKAS